MQGNIDFSGTLSGSIAGGGSGGSEVTITPTLQSGTKIADYTIDETSGSLYAPTPTISSANLPLSISDSVLSIDLSDYMTESEIYTFFPTTSYVNNMFQSMSRDLQENYQKKLIAGTGISIDSVTNTISCTASGGGIDYSTSEQDTGLLWYNGDHIYQKTYTTTLNNTSANIPINISNLGIIISMDGVYVGDNGSTFPLNEFVSGSNFATYTHYNSTTSNIDCFNNIGLNSTVYVTLKYTKSN